MSAEEGSVRNGMTEEKTNGKHGGDDQYDPYVNDSEEPLETPSKATRSEQLKNESIRTTNNGTHPSTVNNSNNYRSRHSDRRSRSPSHHHHHHQHHSSSSDRKRLRPSSPSMTSNDSSRSRYRSRHRSSSRSPSPSQDKSSSIDQIKNDSHHNRHRSHSSRHHHQHSSNKWTRPSPPPAISTNSSTTSSSQSTTTNDRNRSKPVNETNGSSQRSRSNLIQIMTSEPSIRLASTVTKPEPTKAPVDSIETTTNSKSNGNSTGPILMEEMLLDEEQEQTPVKNIDLDSLTIPGTSNEKIEKKETIELTKSNPPALITVPSLTPSPTKIPYMLYKVPNTNHTTPSLSARYKKSVKTENDTNDENSQRTSLEERLSTMFGTNRTPSNEQSTETRSNPTQTLSTPSDKSNGSPQDIPGLISTTTTTTKKTSQTSDSTMKKLPSNDERRPSGSKTYTTEWIATQKPEEATAPQEELPTFPPLANLPTLVSSQNTSTGNSEAIGKLSEVMSKFIQKQNDATQGTATTTTTTSTTAPTEGDDVVPSSAKHLERLERRKEREKRQSEIAAIAKEALKPAFKKNHITKDEYKEIMKKVVTRVTNANEIDRNRIRKMIDGYLEKFRLIRQHKQSSEKTTTKTANSNGNPHPSLPLTHSR